MTPTFLALAISIGGVMTAFIWIIVIVALAWLFLWVLGQFGVTDPIAKVARIAVVVLAVLLILLILLNMVGMAPVSVQP